jgi:hypothetical protein
MGNAERLRLLAASSTVAGFIPSLAEVLYDAAEELDGYLRLTVSLRAELDQLDAQVTDALHSAS